MGDYNLSYTGPQVNAALAESARLVSEGGGVSAQELEDFSMEISNTYALKTSVKNSLYAVVKDTFSGTTITITVPGHANSAYDRISIWAFGNMNGTPYYGIITTSSASDGTSPTAKFTGSHAPTCTYANSGSDRVITVSGLAAWGTMVLISNIRIL